MPVLRGIARDLRARTVSITDGYVNRWDSTGALLDFLGFASATRRYMTQEQALTVTAVWRAVSLLSNVAASMPLHVYQDGGEGRKQIKLDSEGYIWRKPNPEVNRFVFWATVFLHLVLNGNAYIYVVSVPDSPRRRPVELWPIEPKRVHVQRDEAGKKLYLIDGVTPARDWVAGGELVHIQGLGTDGLKGLSPIALFAQSLGLSLAAESYAAHFFGNGSLPGGYLSSDQDLTVDQMRELSEVWEEYHRGIENAHKAAVLGRGTKWNTTSLNPEDAQLLLTRSFQVADVSRMFGVPEHLLGSHDKQTSWGTGIAEQNRGLLIYTLDPYVINAELTISEELLMPANHYARFAREGLLRGTPTERAQFYKEMIAGGIYTPNIVLSLEDMETIGPDGDIRLRPANMVPLNTPAPTTPPPPEPAPTP